METRARLDYIVLHSPDIDRLRTFYETMLDIDFAEEKHGIGPKHYSCKIGDVTLELYPAKQAANVPIIGIEVPDVHEIVRRVGTEYLHKQPERTDHGHMAVLRDTDNRPIHLVDRKSPFIKNRPQ
ncbi:MAG: hypothetical protein HY518_00765 [Candidatus Aenigmarchaeota archaeon]|nr:hypothetical protein [Candidatus Aenigmarchaeota archaeon]